MVIKEILGLSDPGEVLIILQYLLDKPRSWILLNQDHELEGNILNRLFEILEKRKDSYPLQYLLGRWAFYDFEVYVEEGVLIPRPETELLVEEALKVLNRDSRVLEIGPGTGIISIALAKHRGCKVRAVDISSKAVDLAKKNASFNRVDIELVQGDVYEPISGKFDLIISNPPYIREDEEAFLKKELSYEPKEALYAGADGMDIIKKIVVGARPYLRPGGSLMLEIGYDQGQSVKSLFKDQGFQDIIIRKDYNNQDRIVKGHI